MRYTDPSGHAICVSDDCVVRVHPVSGKPIGMRQKWGIIMRGPWEEEKTWMVYEGMRTISERVGEQLKNSFVPISGDEWIRKNIGGTVFERWPNDQPFIYNDGTNYVRFSIHPAITAYQIYHQTKEAPAGVAFPRLGKVFPQPTIHFFDDMWWGTPVHEVGHIIDYKSGGASLMLSREVSTSSAPTEYGKTDRLEDFAESWRLWIYEPKRLASNPEGIYRYQFIVNLVVDLGRDQ